ncbi:MAG: cyclohexanecarboxylate-CoA ligase [Alphaproteobacteria bacterium]|nr:MAG: cyclohexanecarboxylate-CoA ligase [Alphaproteobacteria bacterium]
MDFPVPDPVRARLYREAGHWRDETIPALVRQAAARSPDKVAVRDASGASLSYRDLEGWSDRLAGFLGAQGVGKGDIVTVCLPNWWQTVVVFLAVMKIGGIVNPIPTTYGRADLAFVLGKCRSAALVIPGRFRNSDFTSVVTAAELAIPDHIPVIRVGDGQHDVGIPFERAVSHEPLSEQPAIDADDPVAVLFTSGTESRAKGAVHTHNTILFGERALGEALGIGSNDIAFMASPISHTTGFMHGFVMTLTTGGTLSLLDIFDGTNAAAQMREHRCTWTMGATPFLADVAAALDMANERLPDLRYYLCGGAPIPEALVRRAADIGLRVLSIYGSTESPPHTVVHPGDPARNAWETDGRPLAGIEVRIVSDRGVPVAVGEIGEEWSRGPNTFLGYLGEPELTRKDLDEDGWYHSGDLARALPDGSIRITGRLKDIIVRGGQNISVREVEDYLAAHPAIASVAVVGVPHPRLGETVCAVVVTKPRCRVSLPDLTSFLLIKGVARFKLPERLEVWPSLPATPSGKIQKFLIRKRLGDPQAGTTS